MPGRQDMVRQRQGCLLLIESVNFEQNYYLYVAKLDQKVCGWTRRRVALCQAKENQVQAAQRVPFAVLVAQRIA